MLSPINVYVRHLSYKGHMHVRDPQLANSSFQALKASSRIDFVVCGIVLSVQCCWKVVCFRLGSIFKVVFALPAWQYWHLGKRLF